MRTSMRPRPLLSLLVLFSLAGACRGDRDPVSPGDGGTSLRVINAFTTPVDILIDGQVVASGVAPAAIDTVTATAGAHTVTFRTNGATTSETAVTTAEGALATIAAVRVTSGSIGSAVLDDTNSVVPAGATKLRVLHLAPNAGELQVYRTQPDFQTPTRWQFPFTYQATPTSLSAPFYQSTVGTWDVRVWQTPADASGWSTAPLRVLYPLESGRKGTIVLLDKPGGGVRAEIL